MKKILAVICLLLIATLSFAAPLTVNKYWSDRLNYMVDPITSINPVYTVKFVSDTPKDLHIVVSADSVVFTKYDNITVSAMVIKELAIIKTYNTTTILYIDTFPYSRAILIKDLLSPPKKQSLLSITVLTTDETQKKK